MHQSTISWEWLCARPICQYHFVCVCVIIWNCLDLSNQYAMAQRPTTYTRQSEWNLMPTTIYIYIYEYALLDQIPLGIFSISFRIFRQAKSSPDALRQKFKWFLSNHRTTAEGTLSAEQHKQASNGKSNRCLSEIGWGCFASWSHRHPSKQPYHHHHHHHRYHHACTCTYATRRQQQATTEEDNNNNKNTLECDTSSICGILSNS